MRREKKDKLKLTNKHLLALLRSQSKQSYLVLYSGCNFKSWWDGQTDEMNYKYLNIEMRGDVNITVLRWSSFIREFHNMMMNCLISGISSLQTSQAGQGVVGDQDKLLLLINDWTDSTQQQWPGTSQLILCETKWVRERERDRADWLSQVRSHSVSILTIVHYYSSASQPASQCQLTREWWSAPAADGVPDPIKEDSY